MSLKLIVIYAAYGDALLLKTPDNPPKYWLIDGGPIKPHPVLHFADDQIPLNAYYQYLKRALHRYCSSKKDGVIDMLSGVIVTHPDGDHMDGINRLLREDLIIPDNFKGPVVLNSTFYRRAGAHFEYPLTQFLDQSTFDGSKFGLAEVDNQFQPTNMKNGSLADVYKMVLGEPRIPYPQPADHKWEKHDLDKSTQNWSSIITMWLESVPVGNAKLNLVTTGDGLPSYILNRMNTTTPWDPIPAVGIFKVPHHGSEYNNQWADNPSGYVSPNDEKAEKNVFFYLTMLALQHSDLASINPPSPPENVLVMSIFRDSVLMGSPMLDWKIAREATQVEFVMAIQQLSDRVRTRLETGGAPAKVEHSDYPQPFDLKTTMGLRGFADALLARYDSRETQIIGDGHIVDGTLGASKVTVPFDRDAIIGELLRNIPDVSTRKETTAIYNSLLKCLNENALHELHKARLVQNFYSKFTADNYVISGNIYPHFHPKPSVVAGLMAHVILTARDPTNPGPGRIFMTDGASFQLDYVCDLLMKLLSHSSTPLPKQWNQKVAVYCLATDFLAEIPDDLVSGRSVTRIDFSTYGTISGDENYFRFLHKQFLKAKPYDMPRAAISHTSTFCITIRSNRDPATRYLDMDATGTLLPTQITQPRFHLQPIDHDAAKIGIWTYKKEPHFKLFTERARQFPHTDIVFIHMGSGADPTRTDSYVYKDKDSVVGQLQRLHLDNGAISFKTDDNVDTVATVQFQRNPGF